MRVRTALPLSVIFTSLTALSAQAGSSYVENSYRLRSITNGRSLTNINISETYQGWREAVSSATKREWGATAVSEWRDGRDFREQERFDITATSKAYEKGDFIKNTDVYVRETYHFTGFEKDHRVTSGFDF